MAKYSDQLIVMTDEDKGYHEKNLKLRCGIRRIYNPVPYEDIFEKKAEKPDKEMYEEFVTDTLRIESPLHGTPAAYDLKSGRLVRELEKDTYLTYVTQAGDYVVVQFVTADGCCYGQVRGAGGTAVSERRDRRPADLRLPDWGSQGDADL